jgi:hypothetical protein
MFGCPRNRVNFMGPTSAALGFVNGVSDQMQYYFVPGLRA